MKSLLRSPFVISCVGVLLWAWMAMVARTTRWTYEGEPELSEAWATQRGILGVSWHEQIMLLPSGWTRKIRHWPARPGGLAMLVSLSRDAEPVARALDHLGITAIRGSKANDRKRDKDKGGVRALAEAVRHLKAGGALCVTPDGPRGPALEVSQGPVLLAQRADALIVPYALAVSHHSRTGSWDRMVIPRPFGRGAIVFGSPIDPRQHSADEVRRAMQAGLDAANARAGRLLEGSETATA